MGAIERLGKYELLERLGAGGMAEVFRARFKAAAGTEREVVIKRMLPFPDEEREHIEQLFVSEARLSMQLTHGNVVQVFDCGEHAGQYFLVMEFVDGLSLADVLKALRARGVPTLRAPLAALIVIEVLKGLKYAHTRAGADGQALSVVHRDVSPDNVLLGRDGQVKLADFGIARASISGRVKTEPGVFRGKLSYSAPEQVRGDEVDARADVYSTGLVLWRSVAGKNPQVDLAFKLAMQTQTLPAPPRELVDEVMSNILQRATAREAEARYASARDFLVELQTWVDQQEIPQRDTAIAQLVAWARRGPDRVEPAFAEWLEGAPRATVEREVLLATPAENLEPAAQQVTRVDRPRREASPGALPWLVGAVTLGAMFTIGWVTLRGDGSQPQPLKPMVLVEPEKPVPVAQPPSMTRSLAPPVPAQLGGPGIAPPVASPASEAELAPVVPMSATGAPVRFLLSSRAHGLDVGVSGLGHEAPGDKLLVRSAGGGLFFAPAVPGRIEVVGEKELRLPSQRGRFFVLGPTDEMKTATLMMSWVAGGRVRTSTRERAQLDAAVSAPFFHLGGLDPKKRYRIEQPVATERSVLVVGESPHVKKWYELPPPRFFPASAVPLQAILSPRTTLEVTGVAGLRFVLLQWPDEEPAHVDVAVEIASHKSKANVVDDTARKLMRDSTR